MQRLLQQFFMYVMLHSYKAPFHILFLARQSSNFSASWSFWLLKKCGGSQGVCVYVIVINNNSLRNLNWEI